jgi:hypothetical protein
MPEDAEAAMLQREDRDREEGPRDGEGERECPEGEDCKKKAKKGSNRMGKDEGAKYDPKPCGVKPDAGELTDEQFECLDNQSLVAGSTISAKWFQPKPEDDYRPKNFRMQRGMSVEGWCFIPDFQDNTDDEMDEASMLRSSSVILEGASNLLLTSAVATIALSLY